MKKIHIFAVLMALGIVFTGCNSETVEEINNALKEKEQNVTSASTEAISEESATESESVSESTDSSSVIEESATGAKPSGSYVFTYIQDYVDGEETCEDIYTFNDDGTGSLSGQDTVPITWDEKYIYMDNEPYAEYKLEGDILKEHALNGDEWIDFTKSASK